MDFEKHVVDSLKGLHNKVDSMQGILGTHDKDIAVLQDKSHRAGECGAKDIAYDTKNAMAVHMESHSESTRVQAGHTTKWRWAVGILLTLLGLVIAFARIL